MQESRAALAEPPSIPDDELRVFEVAARDLVGVALRSLEAMQGAVSLPQFRLLLVLHDQGRMSSSQVARVLGLAGSSVTRLADRLTASGHLSRGEDLSNRNLVILELTSVGRDLVQQAIAHRRRDLAALLGRLDPETRASCAEGLRKLHELAGDEYTIGLHGAMPL